MRISVGVSQLTTMLQVVIVVLLLVCSTRAATIHSDSDDPVVVQFIRTLDGVNNYVRNNHLSSVSLPSFSKGNFLARLSLSNGYFGNLSSFVIDEPYIYEDSKGLKETLYNFRIGLHMDDLVFKYIYDVIVLGIHLNHGLLKVTPVNNAAIVQGSVRISSSNKCKASLDNAKVSGMDILRIEFDEETFFHKIIKYSFDIIINFVYDSLKSPIQAMINTFVNVDAFKKDFSNIVCRQFLK